MVEISMEDIFYGFVRNYHSFGIRSDSNWTKWTNEILGYYAKLGRMLGNYIEYEWKKYDLTWFWALDDDEPWFHVEHENSKTRLPELIKRVKISVSEYLILIGYPGSLRDQNDFISQLEELRSQHKNKEVLTIIDTSFYTEEDDIPLNGYIIKSGKKTAILEALKILTNDGFYYAIEKDDE